MSRPEDLQRALEEAGQHHVTSLLRRLPEERRRMLAAQLEHVDLVLVQRLVRELREDRPVATLDLDRLEPPQIVPLPLAPGAKRKEKRAVAAGQDALRRGKVAALVVAGGQGSRLGFDGPKGLFPIGPVSGCSLFEWHFAKVAATRARYGAPIPMLVLTSRANHDDTERFLAEHDWFGLPRADVHLFKQGMLPAVDDAGRLLLESEERLSLSPDGHGGSLAALRAEGVLDRLEHDGIDHLFYFQVDNPLVKVLDPAFVGHHVLARSEMSSKVVMKTDASEKVGVFARAGRKLGIVEYSDLPASLAQATGADGSLVYAAGNVAIHVIATPFVRRLTEGGLQLPYHRARKKIAHVDESGRRVEPDAPNGVKFETFVFDALPLAKRPIVVETSRDEEFAPVKNASGTDSAASARDAMCRLFRGWLADAGLAVRDGAVVEISPRVALDRSAFTERVRKSRSIDASRVYLA